MGFKILLSAEYMAGCCVSFQTEGLLMSCRYQRPHCRRLGVQVAIRRNERRLHIEVAEFSRWVFTTTLAVSLAVAELLYTRRSRICFAMALNPPPRVGVNSHYQKKCVRKWSDTVWECCRSGVGTQPCWVDLRWPPPSSLPINHSANYSSNYVITMPLKHIQHKLRKSKVAWR